MSNAEHEREPEFHTDETPSDIPQNSEATDVLPSHPRPRHAAKGEEDGFMDTDDAQSLQESNASEETSVLWADEGPVETDGPEDPASDLGDQAADHEDPAVDGELEAEAADHKGPAETNQAEDPATLLEQNADAAGNSADEEPTTLLDGSDDNADDPTCLLSAESPDETFLDETRVMAGADHTASSISQDADGLPGGIWDDSEQADSSDCSGLNELSPLDFDDRVDNVDMPAENFDTLVSQNGNAVPMGTFPSATSKKPQDSKGWFIVTCVLIALIGIGAGYAMAQLHPGDKDAGQTPAPATSTEEVAVTDNQQKQDTDTQDEPSDTQEDKEELTQEEKERAMAIETLVGCYNRLRELDKKIAENARDFNENFTSSDLALRRRYAQEAKAIQEEVFKTNTTITANWVPQGNKDVSKIKAAQIGLVGCLSQRIECLVEAWELDIEAGSNAANEKDRILAPLQRDVNSSGVNTCKIYFDKNIEKGNPAGLS